MLDILEEFFSRAHGRRLVATEFLKKGIRVDQKGNIFLGAIELAPAKIARALDIDRRVVIQTAKEIAHDDKLLAIFYYLEPRTYLGNAARELGFDSIVVRANPKGHGIVSAVTKILADEKVVIRQIVSDDPDLFPDPVLTIVIDGKLKTRAIEAIKQLPFTESILIK